MIMKTYEPDMRRLLQAYNLRPTRARMQILRLLSEHRNHLSAEEIIDALRKSREKAGAATYYQNLAKLAEAGLLLRFTGPDGLIRYDSNLMPHHHMVCNGCGKVEDVGIDKGFKAKLQPVNAFTGKRPKGWRVDGLQMQFKGLCPDCGRKA